MKTWRRLLVLPLIFYLTSPSMSQVTGTVELKSLGIRFTIPAGWFGQEGDGAYLLGSNSEPGLIIMTLHDYQTVDELKAEASAGIHDHNGTNLQLKGDLQAIKENGVAGEFGGTLEWQQARVFIAGLTNPHGKGVTVMATTDEMNYSDRYRALALEIVNSIHFSKPETAPVVEEWKTTLKNSRLTYMDSYSSSGGGYSNEEVIDLCGQGHFNYRQSSDMSIDTGGAFGSSHGRGKGSGNWEVVGDGANGALLRLNFYSGEVYEYKLSYEDKKTFLNGYRYFRTYAQAGAEYAPECY